MIIDKMIIDKLIKKLIPSSKLDGIIEEGFVPVTELRPEDFVRGYDLELYSKGKERIIYDGKNDRILRRYNLEL